MPSRWPPSLAPETRPAWCLTSPFVPCLCAACCSLHCIQYDDDSSELLVDVMEEQVGRAAASDAEGDRLPQLRAWLVAHSAQKRPLPRSAHCSFHSHPTPQSCR